jgi:hypothetical protein
MVVVVSDKSGLRLLDHFHCRSVHNVWFTESALANRPSIYRAGYMPTTEDSRGLCNLDRMYVGRCDCFDLT